MNGFPYLVGSSSSFADYHSQSDYRCFLFVVICFDLFFSYFLWNHGGIVGKVRFRFLKKMVIAGRHLFVLIIWCVMWTRRWAVTAVSSGDYHICDVHGCLDYHRHDVGSAGESVGGGAVL